MPSHLLTQRAYQRRRKAALKARGICPWCGKAAPAPGRSRCEACLAMGRANAKAYMARRRSAWKALVICTICGSREAIRGRSRCGVCVEQQDEYRARRRSESRRGAAHA